MSEPDLTRELDAAEEIVMGRADGNGCRAYEAYAALMVERNIWAPFMVKPWPGLSQNERDAWSAAAAARGLGRLAKRRRIPVRGDTLSQESTGWD